MPKFRRRGNFAAAGPLVLHRAARSGVDILVNWKTTAMNPKTFWLSLLLAWPVPLLAQDQALPAGEIAFEEVIDRLLQNNMTAEEIRTTDNFERLEVVDLEGLAPDQALTLNEVLDQTEDSFAEVQTAIETNALLDLELEKQSVELLRVFAATKSTDGVITIYLR